MAGNWSNWTEFVQKYCGSEFWNNDSRYENSTWPPNFTPCFQYTVLTGLPALLLFLLSPIFTFQLEWLAKRYNLLPLPRTCLRSLKTGSTLILLCSSLAIFVRYLVSWGMVEGQVFFWYPLLRFQTSTCLAHMQRRLHRAGYTSNGILFNATLFLLICSLPEARSWIERVFHNELVKPFDIWALILFTIWFGSLSTYFLCLLGAEKRFKDEELNILENPKLNNSFANKICLNWLSPLVWAKGLLRKNNLTSVNKLHESLNLYKTWNKEWVPKFKKYQQNTTVNTPPSIIDNLFSMFKWELISVGMLRFIADLLQFSSPLFLYLFIQFLDKENEPLWKGISLSVGLFVLLQIRYFMLNYCSMICDNIGLQVRTTLQTVVYKKTLRITKNSLETQSKKQLDNLIESDVIAFQQLFTNIHLFWSPILQIGLTFIAFYYLLHLVSLPLMIYVLLTIVSNLCTLSDEHQVETDSKHLKLLNDVLHKIRTIKIKVWEAPIKHLLNEYRTSEADLKIYPLLLRLLSDASALVAPYLLLLIVIIASIVLKTNVPPTNLFIAIYLIYQVSGPISELRIFSQVFYELLPANTRLKQYLLNEQIDRKLDNYTFDSESEDAIQIENAYFSNDYQIPLPTFLDVNLSVKKGQLVAIVGEDQDQCRRFLCAITNELRKLDGYVKLNGQLGYVEMKPLLMNASVLENIKLFADKHQRQLYDQVVEKCNLTDVLNAELRNKEKNGNLNEILTQSQKIKIALTRVLYHQSDILLFEDIFSHLDTLMAKQVFSDILQSFLEDKTRLFITNNIDFIKQADSVIFVNGPNVVSNTFSQLITTDPDFDILARNLELHQSSESNAPESTQLFGTTSVKLQKTANPRVTWEDIDEADVVDERDTSPLINSINLSKQEFKTYWHFFKSLQLTLNLVAISALPILLVSLQIIQSVWLTDWLDKDWMNNDNFDGHFSLNIRLGIFMIVGLLQLLFFVSASYLLAITFAQLTSKIYERTTGQILNAPIGFFNTETINKLSTIFNKDIQLFDSLLPKSINSLAFYFVYTSTFLFFLFVINPLTIFFTLFIAAILGCLIVVYIKKSRQLANMKRTIEQHVFTHLFETHKLVPTIRVFQRSLTFAWKNDDFLDAYVRVAENHSYLEHWMRLRIMLSANALFLATTLSLLFLRHSFELSTNWIIMTLALILNLPFFLQKLVNELNVLATNTISSDKIKMFDAIEPEKSATSNALSDDWPNKGEIQFENVSTYKQPESNLSLQNLTFKIDSSQKIIVVGDDNSNKDAIIDLIFRLNEPSGGLTHIDEIDLSSIDLKILRQRMSIVPEKSALFNESIRFNLDPTETSTDDQLWNALKAVNLDLIIASKWADGLPHQIDVEDDLSVHQKWLFELARLILNPSKVVIIEEPVGSMETSTTEAIMKILRRECADSTILIFASNIKSAIHRDFPILLLENGELKGFDLAHKLITENDSPTTSSQI